MTAQTGDRVKVQYVGVSYSTGKQFDASWDRGEPYTFTLGAGNVISGWDQGLVGMKVGGRRRGGGPRLRRTRRSSSWSTCSRSASE